MAEKLQQQLRDIGSKLKNPPSSKDALIKLLKQAANCLSEIEQSPLPSILDSMKPCIRAIMKQELLKHQDSDIKVLVVTCICDITRITAPDVPFSDDVFRDVFNLIVGTFSGLSDIHCLSFGGRVVILEKLARYRLPVVMLDLECDDLINEMFSTFFDVVSDDHPKNVLTSMQQIMVHILDESEDIQENLLSTILSPLGRERTDFSLTARRLAMDVINHCEGKLEPCIKQFFVSSLSRDRTYLNNSVDPHEVMYDVYQCAPKILSGVVPYITGELLSDVTDVRLKAVQLVGELFALPGLSISESFQPVFCEFLKRLTDIVVEVRISVIGHLRNCLISNPARPEGPSIIKALCDLLLDHNEDVRQQVVAALHKVACHSLEVIPAESVKQVAERLEDNSVSVKRYTMDRLADLYRFYYLKSADSSACVDKLEWIPRKILKCLYDKDFRSEDIELILCGFLFPPESSVNDRLKHWAKVFSELDKVEVKTLEQILVQKKRLQQEMQKYLSFRQTYQDDASELQKRISGCVRAMSRLFSEPAKAEESFQILDQLKEVNIWKSLATLLDPCTSFHQAWSCRDELLKSLGDKHPLHDFLGMLSTKCSYILFNKEDVKEILVEVSAQKSVGDVKLISSCMGILAIIASFSPDLLTGFEENLVNLLKEDNEMVKEGVSRVLAKAGGAIREQLATTSSSVDLLLERLCLEGSRKQAKYSVQALAAITEDDGLKSLSVLYKRLVDMLEKKTNLPAILQSLGCIAQIAMPIFETREDEIFGFIKHKVLEINNKKEEISINKAEWNERSELCQLKIFSIKTLVKSYLPTRDAHLRPGIEKIIEILKNILSFGDISKDTESSAVDKAHMRLASAKAVLRLSSQWDHKIPLDVFYMTLRVAEDVYAQSRKLFISKVQQYITEHRLDPKYACSFLLNIKQFRSPEYEEGKHNLFETIRICQQAKVMQSDEKSTVCYPEYILVYLVHALAHHPSCASIDECKDVKQFEPVYWCLHLFLSVLFHRHEDGQSGCGPNTRENHAKVVSIFHSIKCSEDAYDRTKTKILHAICDLGLSIAKRLVSGHCDINGMANSMALPSTLYKPTENKDGKISVDNGEQPLLGGDGIYSHFEAFQVKDNEPSVSGATKDEMVLEERDKDDNDIPLRKMMKILKSQGAKRKKTLKRNTTTSDAEVLENDGDVLGVVREINLDTIKCHQSVETGELTNNNVNTEDRQMSEANNNEEVSASAIEKEINGIAFLNVPTPKRKRSVPLQRSQSKCTNGQSENRVLFYSRSSKVDKKKNLSSVQNLVTEKDVESTVPDLAFHLPTIKSTSKNNDDESKIGVIISDPEKSTNNKKFVDSRSSTGSSKKRKISSTSGLTKCSLHDTLFNDEELVGSRIKVWWPLDKAFYEGIVQAYDEGKKKHVILYDDGDIEVLDLDKEKWELIIDADVPGKQAKNPHPLPNKGKLLEKQNNSSNSKQKRKSPKRKTASKKHAKYNRGKTSKNESRAGEVDSESKGDSDLSDVHSHSGSEVDDVNSAGHEGRNEESLQEEKSDPASSNNKDDSDDDSLRT